MSSPKKSPNIVLSPEQKARIEENRRKALELYQARQIKFEQNKNLPRESLKILPTKNSSNSSNRVTPYLKPQNQQKLTSYLKPLNDQKSNAPTTIQKPQTASTKVVLSPKKQMISCTFEIQSSNRFAVQWSGYDEEFFQVLKKINSSIWVREKKVMTFDLADYNNLISSLSTLKYVKWQKLPELVVRHMTKVTEQPNESCLEQIEPELMKTLLDFQKEGIAFAISREGRCMIADGVYTLLFFLK